MSEPSPEASSAPEVSVAQLVEDAFAESYGWPGEPAWANITAFEDEGSRVIVVTDLSAKAENEEFAMGLCRAVTSVTIDAEWRGVFVTAGEGGRFLAECDTF